MADKPISEKIRERIQNNPERNFYCNHNISEFIEEGELDELVAEVTEKVDGLLRSLVIDIDNDHNTQGTAHRVAKMFINETFRGRYHPKPKITSFPNELSYDQLYITGPIEIRSTCAHHFQNIVGKCFIGVYPGKNVLGLSKFTRLAQWITERPTIQEEMTEQVADLVLEETHAEGVAVIIKAEHMCMSHRGVRAHEPEMITSSLRGCLRDDPTIRNEFLMLVSGMKGY